MQTSFTYASLVLVLNAVFLQMVWFWLTKRGRNSFVDAITQFKPPQGTLANYYGWSVSSVRNAIIDGVVFEMTMLVFLLGLLFVSVPVTTIIGYAPIIILVISLSSVSTIQMTLRVRTLARYNSEIRQRMKDSDDKIGTARILVEDQLRTGRLADGKMWFALYRVAQIQNPIGWAVRDVLLDDALKDKYRQILQTPSNDGVMSSQDEGPGIESD